MREFAAKFAPTRHAYSFRKTFASHGTYNAVLCIYSLDTFPKIQYLPWEILFTMHTLSEDKKEARRGRLWRVEMELLRSPERKTRNRRGKSEVNMEGKRKPKSPHVRLLTDVLCGELISINLQVYIYISDDRMHL